MRRQIKRVFGWVAFRSGFYRRFLRGKALIVAFHRVDDRYEGDPISCTVREFEDYCRFMARYFDVVTVTELMDLLASGGDISGKLVITFDDGYADNVAAAEIMRSHGLPGCFFITTDFIGTDLNGPWDVHLGQESYWMDWEDVRQLDEWGFELGAHTCNHVDLGVVDGEAAVAEITGSKEALESRLGRRIDHFAYPFGRRDCITAENLAVVRAAGFRTCMSAYGGAVTARSYRYEMQRVAVSPWHRSPWQLGMELLLEKPMELVNPPVDGGHSAARQQ